MNDYVVHLFDRYLDLVLDGDCVAIPDDPEEMNWRIFFAHSQDMQGFRADIFTGGPNEPVNPCDDDFTPLRVQWGDTSYALIAELALLWEDELLRSSLTRMSNPMRPKEERQKGIAPALEILESSGVRGARVFADVLRRFAGPNIARKTNMMIRAYIQNAHLLKQHGYSYRSYLLPHQDEFPSDVLAAEAGWIRAIDQEFYNVGPALANYMICDWLLWMWREGRIDSFASYKEDSVHGDAIKSGKLPEEATDFVAFCRGIRIPDGHGTVSGRPCPPRVLNECIWLDGNQSSWGRGDPGSEDTDWLVGGCYRY